jgi:hypothetical protein
VNYRGSLDIPDRGKRRLNRYVELLRNLEPSQLDHVSGAFPETDAVIRSSTRLFKGWYDSPETRAEWQGPLTDAQQAINTLATDPSFTAKLLKTDEARQNDEFVPLLREVCQALIYNRFGAAEADVATLYSPFEPFAPWDQLGRLR